MKILAVNIQKREKENSKKTEISNVLGMYLGCMTDILYRLKQDPKESNEIQMEMENLRKYTNQCFKTLTISYNCKIRVIDDKFIFH